MAEVRFSSERVIPAPPDTLHALLADYREGHPSILPPAFTNFAVLEGGTDEGTRIRFNLTLAGRTQSAVGRVSELEPGRVLVETYENGMTTTFTVDPAPGGSRLRIETNWEAGSGPAGWVERLMAPRLLKPLYRDELDRIAAWARQHRKRPE